MRLSVGNLNHKSTWKKEDVLHTTELETIESARKKGSGNLWQPGVHFPEEWVEI